MAIFLIEWHELYLMDKDLDNLRNLNESYCGMIGNVIQLRNINFLTLKLPRFGYVDQTQIFNERVPSIMDFTHAW